MRPRREGTARPARRYGEDIGVDTKRRHEEAQGQ